MFVNSENRLKNWEWVIIQYISTKIAKSFKYIQTSEVSFSQRKIDQIARIFLCLGEHFSGFQYVWN